MSLRPIVALVVLAASLAGCSPAPRSSVSPQCDFSNGSVLALAAQSVPTAALLPCIDDLPAGWTLRNISARSGETRFHLDSDDLGERFLEVTLTGECDHEIIGQPLIVAGGFTRRSIEAVAERHRYTGNWYFSFDGGCVRYRLAATGEAVVDIHTQIEQALSFVTRAAVDRFVRTAVGIELDPGPARTSGTGPRPSDME